ncbi:hypothetical protein APHAL10511_004187 [Amanita phalloides]|nr:hypothetical protein APHAL10511_004187 [Amanita phalloides]
MSPIPNLDNINSTSPASATASSSLPTLPSATNPPTVTGPFGFSFSLPGALQKTLSFTFAARLRASIKNTAMGTTYRASESQPLPGGSRAPATTSDPSEIDEDPASQIPRPVSPVPTEIIEDPPVEEIISNVEAQGIKIRDFASPEETQKTSLRPVFEVFDPYRAVAEFEYRLGVKTFRRPVPGKTLRRLLEMGWITSEEVAQRCAPMDIESLKIYDEKVEADVNEGRGVYPWRALKWNTVPAAQERKRLVVKYMWHFVAVDRARKHLEALERKAQLSKEQAEEDERLALEILRRRELQKREHVQSGVLPDNWDSLTLPKLFKGAGESSRKRSWNDITDQAGGTADGRETYDGDGAHGNPKRICLSPRASSSALPSFLADNAHLFLPQSQEEYRSFTPPAKQYPAPLSSYDPSIYPEAASIINSQSQQRGLLAKGSTPPGTPPTESQCLPLEESSPPRLRSSLRGKLARTQTFTLL